MSNNKPTAKAMASPPRASLLGIPPELRLQIYGHLQYPQGRSKCIACCCNHLDSYIGRTSELVQGSHQSPHAAIYQSLLPLLTVNTLISGEVKDFLFHGIEVDFCYTIVEHGEHQFTGHSMDGELGLSGLGTNWGHRAYQRLEQDLSHKLQNISVVGLNMIMPARLVIPPEDTNVSQVFENHVAAMDHFRHLIDTLNKQPSLRKLVVSYVVPSPPRVDPIPDVSVDPKNDYLAPLQSLRDDVELQIYPQVLVPRQDHPFLDSLRRNPRFKFHDVEDDGDAVINSAEEPTIYEYISVTYESGSAEDKYLKQLMQANGSRSTTFPGAQSPCLLKAYRAVLDWLFRYAKFKFDPFPMTVESESVRDNRRAVWDIMWRLREAHFEGNLAKFEGIKAELYKLSRK